MLGKFEPRLIWKLWLILSDPVCGNLLHNNGELYTQRQVQATGNSMRYQSWRGGCFVFRVFIFVPHLFLVLGEECSQKPTRAYTLLENYILVFQNSPSIWFCCKRLYDTTKTDKQNSHILWNVWRWCLPGMVVECRQKYIIGIGVIIPLESFSSRGLWMGGAHAWDTSALFRIRLLQIIVIYNL